MALLLPKRDGKEKLLEKFLFALCGLGLNITFAIYLAYVNIYGEAFSRSILGWMNLFIYIAATAVVFAQIQFDNIVDRKFSAKASYTFRICVGLLVIFFTLLFIPFASYNVNHVYLIGILIGVFEGSGLSSVQQLASVVDPQFTKHVNTGFTVAQVLPIALSVALGFYKARAGSFAAIAFAWIPASLVLAAAVLFFVVVLNDNFDVAFKKMDETLANQEVGDELPDTEATPLVATRTSKSAQAESVWMQTPVMLCACIQFTTNWLSMFLMPFVTYFGGNSLAHMLVLVRFGSELMGRIVSHYWGFEFWNLDYIKGIYVLVAVTILRAALLMAVLLDPLGVYQLQTVTLFTLVSIFYLTFGWSQSEVMTVIVKAGPEGADAQLTRGMMFLCFAAQLVSLAIAVALVELHLAPDAVVSFMLKYVFG